MCTFFLYLPCGTLKDGNKILIEFPNRRDKCAARRRDPPLESRGNPASALRLFTPATPN